MAPVPRLTGRSLRTSHLNQTTTVPGDRSPDPRLEAITRALEEHRRRRGEFLESHLPEPPAGPAARASVALVVRPVPDDLELLVIKRATRSGDPWSGHMALPGGRRAPEDASARVTAERETEEEVGIDLASKGRLLGQLSPVWPGSGAPAIVVSPFVYSVPRHTGVTTNHEVADAFWIGLQHLYSPDAATEYLHRVAGGPELRFPAIAYESHVIWGLTHHIMTEFLEIVGPVVGADQTMSTGSHGDP